MSDAIDLVGGLILESGETWASVAHPLQVNDAAAVLASEPTHRRHWHGRPRGWSKTTDAAGYSIAALLTPELIGPRERGYCCAADRDQAGLLISAMAGLVHRTGLSGALDVETWKVTSRDTGASIMVLASDAASAYGLRSPWWTVDELGQWDDAPSSRRFYEAISTSWPKVPTRVTVISTAGIPGGFASEQYRFALSEPAWRVSEVHEPPPWVSAAEIESERRRLPTSAFLRYWRNEWAQGEDKLLEVADIDACVTLSGDVEYRSGRTYCIGVDLALRNDNAVVLTGHLEGRGSESVVAVDRCEVFAPRKGRDVDLQAVEDLIEARSHEYGGCPVIFDPAQAWQMMARLRSRGRRIVEHTFSASSNTKRTLLLLELVRAHRFWLPDDLELRNEMISLRVKELGPGQYRYDHPVGGHDDRVTALSLVALHLIERPSGPVSTSARQFGRRLGPVGPTAGARRPPSTRVPGWKGPRRGYDPRLDNPDPGAA